MNTVLVIFALVGLLIFAVGAVIYLIARPANPSSPIIMVIGGLIFAVAQAILLLIAVIP